MPQNFSVPSFGYDSCLCVTYTVEDSLGFSLYCRGYSRFVHSSEGCFSFILLMNLSSGRVVEILLLFLLDSSKVVFICAVTTVFGSASAKNPRGSKPLSSSFPYWRSKVGFMGGLCSPSRKLSQIGALFLTSQDRRQSVPPLVHLVEQGSEAMSGGRVEDRLLCSFFFYFHLSLQFRFPCRAILLPSRGMVREQSSWLLPLWYFAVVWEALGLWRLVIGISHLTEFIL